MDTREKIIRFDQVDNAIASGRWIIIAGLFDPLTAVEAERIRAIATAHPNSRVLALVLDRPECLLSAEARALLLAALRRVDLVTTATPAAARAILVTPQHQAEVFADLQADERRSADFVQLVIARQQAGSH